MNPAARGRAGFTLVEMVTSLVILSVLLLACGSMVKMATQSTNDAGDRFATQAQAADAAARVADDLNVAIDFAQRTATGVTFTVPDRLGSGSPQTVAYNWSGTPGDPLLRQFNGGPAAAVLADVKKLGFDYTTRTAGPAPAPAGQAVFSHETTSGSLEDVTLSNKNWASQSFYPSLPSGTTSYSLTRIRVMLKAGAQDAVMTVSVRPADALSKPSTTVLAQSTVYVSALSSAYEMADVPVAGLSGLSPLQNLCVVLGYASGANDVGAVQTDQSVHSILNGASWSVSTNAGVSWSSPSALTCAKISVYGTVP